MHPMLQKAIKYLPMIKKYLGSRSRRENNSTDCEPPTTNHDIKDLKNNPNPLIQEIYNNPDVFDQDYQVTQDSALILTAKLLLDIRELLIQQQQNNSNAPIVPEINDVTAQVVRMNRAVDVSLESGVPVTPIPDNMHKPQDEYR